MRRSLVLLFMILAARSAYGQSLSQSGQQTYSAVDQFSPHKNPNGTWSYGYTLTLGSPFVRYTNQGTTCCSDQVGWFGPFGPAPGYPLVLESSTGPSQSLDVDPGPEGEYGIVRFTAPSNGTWDIVGDYQGTGLTTVDVHILRDSASIYDNVVNGSDMADFGLTLQLKAGETIDFAVGYGGAFGNDPTGFQAVISPHVYDFQTIDFPGAASTQAYGLNSCGNVVGSYVDAQGSQHGFSFSKQDGFKTIDVPGAVAVGLFGINDARNIVGGWIDNSGILRGLLLTGNEFTPVNFPGAVDTVATGINAQGDIVGGYDTSDRSESIGFLLKKGHYSALQDPLAAPSQTGPSGINNKGQIVGEYGDSAGVLHAFLLDEGKYSTIDFPDAQQDSLANGINSEGQVAARYFDGPGNNQGYVLFRGDYTPLVFPGAKATSAQGINDKGQIVGFYRAFGGGPTHGFIAIPGKQEQH